MPFSVLTPTPSVNTEATLAGNPQGISQSNFIRWKQNLPEKRGGCTLYINQQLEGIPNAITPWSDIDGKSFVSVATNERVYAYDTLDNTVQDISPQYINSPNITPNMSTTVGSSQVTIVDAFPGRLTVYDCVTFNTPISIGGIVIQGTYQIVAAGGVQAFVIDAIIPASSTTTEVFLPKFITYSGSTEFVVQFPIQYQYGTLAVGDRIGFAVPTKVGGLTIYGQYIVTQVLSSDQFVLIDKEAATSNAAVFMNNGYLDLTYWITAGPTVLGSGYGANAYGQGPYGEGVSGIPSKGNRYSSPDWYLSGRGASLIASSVGGPIFYWNNEYGYSNFAIHTNAPYRSNGSFVSMPYGNVMAWGCSTIINPFQDPLFIMWSDSNDPNNWSLAGNSNAGFYTIPTGSKIVNGIQAPQQQYWFTDVDMYVAQYVGYPGTFGFNKVGNGCGLVAPNAVGILGNSVFWMSQRQFFVSQSGGAPQQIPCPVWDFIFQNMNENFIQNVVCGTNTLFNEVNWFFPTTDQLSGIPNAYVCFNMLYQEWDYGYLERTAWTDQSLAGPPIASDSNGWVYQHETSYDLNVGGKVTPIDASFRTGYYSIGPGEDLSFVDWILPDMRWGQWDMPPTANLKFTFYVTDYAGQEPRVFGPYPFNKATKFLSPRFRGRFISVKIESSDLGSFWRLGSIRYRLAPSGRR